MEDTTVKKKTSEKTTEKITPRKRATTADIPANEMIEVKNIFPGRLDFISSTGFEQTWEEFGDTGFIPFSELMLMKGRQKTFFVENWVLIVGDRARDVMDALYLDQYYEHAVDPENFEQLLKLKPKALKEKIQPMTDSMKLSIAIQAEKYIADGRLDSITLIKAFEEATGFKLTDN